MNDNLLGSCWGRYRGRWRGLGRWALRYDSEANSKIFPKTNSTTLPGQAAKLQSKTLQQMSMYKSGQIFSRGLWKLQLWSLQGWQKGMVWIFFKWIVIKWILYLHRYGVNRINISLFRYGVMLNTNLVILEMFVLMPLLPCPLQDGTGQEWLVWLKIVSYKIMWSCFILEVFYCENIYFYLQ